MIFADNALVVNKKTTQCSGSEETGSFELLKQKLVLIKSKMQLRYVGIVNKKRILVKREKVSEKTRKINN